MKSNVELPEQKTTNRAERRQQYREATDAERRVMDAEKAAGKTAAEVDLKDHPAEEKFIKDLRRQGLLTFVLFLLVGLAPFGLLAYKLIAAATIAWWVVVLALVFGVALLAFAVFDYRLNRKALAVTEQKFKEKLLEAEAEELNTFT